jgi:hypothetical protein
MRAKPWMQLLEAYHDPTYFGFKNSEQLQKLIATRYRAREILRPAVLRRNLYV